MKQIKESNNSHNWPRRKVGMVDCRERDLVIRIANWMDDRHEPAYDVEVYIGGVYDWSESESFTMFEYKNKNVCKQEAIKFADKQIKKLL